jgi:hypothetical protein
MEEKAFVSVPLQIRVRADIPMVSIGGTHKQDDVCKIGTVDEGMLSKDIAICSNGESLKVTPTVSGDCVVSSAQHMHCRHEANIPSRW